MQGTGTVGGAHEGGSARGHAQEVVLDEVTTGLPIPEAGERNGLQYAAGDEYERPLRGKIREKGADELVVQPRRGPAHVFPRSPSLYRRPVRCYQPRQLGRRQRALDEVGSVSRHCPGEEAIVERNVIDEGNTGRKLLL